MDPISDTLTIIKNGYMARKQSVQIPYSRQKEAIAKKILEAGFLASVDLDKESHSLKIGLLYKEGDSIFHDAKRISKPSLRIYTESKKIPRVLAGRGEVIISTPKGILTGREAKKANLGGELILKIW
ncbi:MAG: 30S ribosomal protein S8 [bacterium]|nr:30S ribosomal protein S8 [bacterium]